MVVKANLGCLKARSRVEKKLRDNSGTAFVDTLIGILIVVVIGGILLAMLSSIFPGLITKITDSVEAFFDNWIAQIKLS